MFPGRDDLVCFENLEGCPESVASDLKLGGESALAGKAIMNVAFGDHFEDDLGCLDRERLAVRNARHGAG